MTGCVSGYAPRNHIAATPHYFRAGHDRGCGIRFAFAPGMKLLLASIVLSALVLWALGCGAIGA